MASFKPKKYRPMNAARVKESSQRTGSKFDNIFIQGITTYKAAVGTNIVRFVKDPDADYYGEDIWVHPYVGIKNSTYLCLKKMKNKPCPICEMAEDAQRAGDKDEYLSLSPKQRLIAYCLDRNDEKAGLKVWDMSWTMDRDIADVCIIKKTGATIDVTDPDAGYDIYFQRVGTTKNNTRYSGFQVDRETTPLSEKQRDADKWIDEVQEKPLLSLLKYMDSDYLADILTGKVEEKDEEGEEDTDRPARAPSTRGRAQRSEPEERDEQGEDNSDGDEQERNGKAPPPRRGSRDAGDREEEREPPRSSGGRRPSARSDEGDEDRPSRASRDQQYEDEEPDDSKDPPQRVATPPRGREARGRDITADEEEEGNRAPPRRGRETREQRREEADERERESESDEVEARQWARGREQGGGEERTTRERAPARTERQRLDPPEDEPDDRGRRGRR